MHHSIQEHPSIITVIGFMNLALCAWVDKSGHWRYLLSVWPIAMGACALVGHVVGLEKLYFFWPPYSYGMPWPSALFFVLGGGVWIGLAYKWRPSGRWMIL